MNSKFEYIDGAIYRRKVRAIILDERGYVLLIQPHQYKDGTWTFVGGGIEDDETSLQAITREVAEEVGIQDFVEIKKSKNQHMFKFSSADKQRCGLDYDGQLADIFLVRVANDSKIKIQEKEVKNFCWVPLDEVKNLVKVHAQFKVFESVISELYNKSLKKAVC